MRTRTRWTTSAAVPLLLLALVTLPAIASIEKANPEDVGLSTARLERIHDAIQRHSSMRSSGTVGHSSRTARTDFVPLIGSVEPGPTTHPIRSPRWIGTKTRVPGGGARSSTR